MKRSIGSIFIIITALFACIKPPKPRVLDPLPPLSPSPTADRANENNEIKKDGVIPGKEDQNQNGLPEVTAAPELTAQPTVVDPIQTHTATPTKTIPANDKKITAKLYGGGGWYLNCVSVAFNKGNFNQLGCNKTIPKKSTDCVATDPSFSQKQMELPLDANSNLQTIKLQITSYHQTGTCENNTKFKYDLNLASHKFVFGTSDSKVRSRFKCGTKQLSPGVKQFKLCFEDSTNNDYRDIIVLFDAHSTELEFSELTPTCNDPVNFNSTTSCL